VPEVHLLFPLVFQIPGARPDDSSSNESYARLQLRLPCTTPASGALRLQTSPGCPSALLLYIALLLPSAFWLHKYHELMASARIHACQVAWLRVQLLHDCDQEWKPKPHRCSCFLFQASPCNPWDYR